MSDTHFTIDRANEAAFSKAAEVRNSVFALKYHIAAPSGWINDPNGLVRFDGRYHAFYQHYPYEPKWGPMHWGHASSADLVHWQHEPVALAPDMPYEKGCFSGSAVDDNGIMTLIYTAHDDDNPIKETQCIARSFDGGKTFVKSPLNPVIPSFPQECCADFRDPKVWRQDGRWQMVVGTSHEGRGCVVLFTSDDLEHWEYRGIMAESDGTLGYMWECPNFCRVDGQDILIISPMGVPGHKNIALFGNFDCASGRMTIDHWQDLDLGEHFYAAQVLYDEDRNLLFGWMNMWDKPDPAAADGWSGALTLPREMHVRNGKLIQSPASELALLRGEQAITGGCRKCLEKLTGNCLELSIGMNDGDFIVSAGEEELLRISIRDGQTSLQLPDGSIFSAALTLPCDQPSLHIFVDQSSVECFVNGGEVCFSERIYPTAPLNYRVTGNATVDAWALNNAFEDSEC